MHFTLPKGGLIPTFPAHPGNQITKEYYNFLVGAINAGIMFKAVLSIHNKTFNTTSYYLVSMR